MTHSVHKHDFASVNGGYQCSGCRASLTDADLTTHREQAGSADPNAVHSVMHPTRTIEVHTSDADAPHAEGDPEPVESVLTVEVPIQDPEAYAAWKTHAEENPDEVKQVEVVKEPEPEPKPTPVWDRVKDKHNEPAKDAHAAPGLPVRRDPPVVGPRQSPQPAPKPRLVP